MSVDTYWTKVAAVRAAYEKWCVEAGETPVSAKALTTSLHRHGVTSARTPRARMYVGVGLRTADEREERGGSSALRLQDPGLARPGAGSRWASQGRGEVGGGWRLRWRRWRRGH